MGNSVRDLRTALEQIKAYPGQYVETDVEADPHLEIAGVYRKVGAGGTIMRPTNNNGPVMMFNNVKGHPGKKIVTGVLGSRKRMGIIMGTPPDQLGFLLNKCVNNPIDAVVIDGAPLCQEVVHRADEPGFDIRNIIPIIQTSIDDPGPCITTGLCRATDPESGETDVTICRMFLQDSKDEITILAHPRMTRHIGMMIQKAEDLNKPLPISISIGLDPAIYMSCTFTPPATPYGYDELSIAGALRGWPVELSKCLTIDNTAVANAEYVIEGEIPPGVIVKEDKLTGKGLALAEFPGYNGKAMPANIIKIKAITHRKDPIYQTLLGPSEEHVTMAGIPTEACILNMVEKAAPRFVQNVYLHSAGGGKFMAVIQVKKTTPQHEGMQRQVALAAFTAFYELKHVFLVDEDVDPFDSTDVFWAMTTRFQGNVDTIFIPGVYQHHVDPSAWPYYSSSSRTPGASCKTIFDCTVPFELKDKFIRARFEDVDVKKFLPDFE